MTSDMVELQLVVAVSPVLAADGTVLVCRRGLWWLVTPEHEDEPVPDLFDLAAWLPGKLARG